MNQRRLFILIFGPIAVIAASKGIAELSRANPPGPPSANEIVVRSQSPENPIAGYPGASTGLPPGKAEKPGEALATKCRLVAQDWDARLDANCHVVVRPPFVVAGNLSESQLISWHDGTIEPAARAMAQSYFETPPSAPITVLLFGDPKSYNAYAKQLFGDEGISVYGYYKPNQRTLVMDISTGGGTLVHELTHALVDFDFPRVPDWFNEGLASLHEQCHFHEDAGRLWIEGLVNWRLEGLQKLVEQKRLRSLETLVSADDFRGRLEGANYAEARYFCLFMQQKQLLPKFYRELKSGQAADPLGVQAVGRVFNGQSWPQLDDEFQRWVLSLKK